MTVTPVADPTVGNLATPVNSSYFAKAFLNALPAYRPALSPNRRGLEVGMAHGFFLYGPFTSGRDTSELQALLWISYAVFCLQTKK